MKRKRLSKIHIFLLVLLSLIMAHFVFFRAPSESEMISKFHQRKAEFERIRLMLQQDRNVESIGQKWAEAKAVETGRLPLNVSASRLALYRSRLRELGFSSVRTRRERIQLEEFGGGFTDTSWGIGYVWTKITPTPLVDSAYNQRPMKDMRHFSRIEGDWYLYHRR